MPVILPPVAVRRVALCLTLLAWLGGCHREKMLGHAKPNLAVIGDPDRGKALIAYYGCGSCHTIAGIAGADGMVGPPLSGFGRRIYIAGLLRNTPDNLIRWIRDPQAVSPGNVMPRMGIDRRDAGDIAAFLYTRREDAS